MAKAKKKKGASIYVICEKSFEYNDETYAAPECGGGQPLYATMDIDLAQKMCHEKNFKHFLEMLGNADINNYFYDMSDTFTQKAIDLLEKHGCLSEEGKLDDEGVKWQKMPLEDVEKIYKGCNVSWYEVYEVESVD